jgi:hypothetical protein
MQSPDAIDNSIKPCKMNIISFLPMDPDLVNGMKAGTVECATVHISSRRGNISIVIFQFRSSHINGLECKTTCGSKLGTEDLDLQLRYECILGNSTNVLIKDCEVPIHIMVWFHAWAVGIQGNFLVQTTRDTQRRMK